MSKSDVERWRKDTGKFMEITELINIEDFDSVWDSVLKKIIVAGVLSKDAHNLEAIDDFYFRIFNEEIENVERHLNFMKKMAKTLSSKDINYLFRSTVYTLSISINNHVMMLLSIGYNKLKEEREIVVLAEKLREIVTEQKKAMEEKIKTYVV